MDFGTDEYEDHDEYEEYDEFEEAPEPRRSFGGMSPVEIGILVGLLVVVCVLVVLVGKSFFGNSVASTETPPLLPTETLTPTEPPNVTSTPWPTVASIPEWNKFEFAESRASLWLPNSYQGGDPIAYPEIVRMTVETYSTDEIFIQSVDDVLLNNPDITFFAFDSKVITNTRIVVVTFKEIHPDLILNMEGFLDDFESSIVAQGDRVVGKEIDHLDNFNAGRIIYEFKTPIGDTGQYTYDKMAIYLVVVDDTLWQVEYRTGRDDFSDFWPIIKDSINTFHAQP